ncbi:MAG: hypothetical protein MRT15_09135 [archaeon YNP-LCB-003-016]|uniref:NUDIX hydrolase n=1 Tax=Candidatus Culexarchaeum yellowstonense TaxID=2928963 RepID=UPI0026ECBD9B|nr:NUDIX domain-containing protein [Candidatus Culexarchaeum yellowstonense]MCR6692543.1 hypothetical protein [Candidatus Culexarchaeum yellowstonense]
MKMMRIEFKVNVKKAVEFLGLSRLESPEKSIEEALLREVKEETRLTVTRYRFVNVYSEFFLKGMI